MSTPVTDNLTYLPKTGNRFSLLHSREIVLLLLCTSRALLQENRKQIVECRSGFEVLGMAPPTAHARHFFIFFHFHSKNRPSNGQPSATPQHTQPSLPVPASIGIIIRHWLSYLVTWCSKRTTPTMKPPSRTHLTSLQITLFTRLSVISITPFAVPYVMNSTRSQ